MTDVSNSRFALLESGGSVRITTGVLKGAGSVGPQGPIGPAGVATTIKGHKPNYAAIAALASPRQGDAWYADDTGNLWAWDNSDAVWNNVGNIKGETGYLQSVSATVEHPSASTNVPGTDAWVTVPFNTVVWNDSEVVSGTTTVPIIVVPNTSTFTSVTVANPNIASCLLVGQVTLTTTAAVRGRARIRFTIGGTVYGLRSMYLDGVSGITQTLDVYWVGPMTSSRPIAVDVSSNVACKITGTRLHVARFGGGVGPQGIQGVQGFHSFMGNPVTNAVELPSTGEPGEMRYVTATGEVYAWNANDTVPSWINAGVFRGPAGSTNNGFSQFDAVSGMDSTAAPAVGGTALATADQAVPYPHGTHTPNVPYFLKLAFEFLERRIVGRFTSLTDLNTKRPTKTRGETYWVDSGNTRGGSLYVYDDRNGGNSLVPFVYYGDNAPASTTTNATNGSLYLEY